MSNEEASDLALRCGHKWRLEVFDAQVGGSITLYYQTREAAYLASRLLGGEVQRHDGLAWVSAEEKPSPAVN